MQSVLEAVAFGKARVVGTEADIGNVCVELFALADGQAVQRMVVAVRGEWQFGAFYHRLKGRLGESQALIATAHKMARVVYVLLKEKQPYSGLSERENEEKFRQREARSLQRRAARLGLSLVPAGAVS